MEIIQSRDAHKSFLALLLICLGIFILLSGSISAQQDKIIDLKVTGNVYSSEKLIKNVSGLQIGDRLTGTAIQEAVRKLYGQGIFRDIFVDVEDVSGGAIVTIGVDEYPQLSQVTFEGNKEINDKDLFS